jgi:hypothetical protein
MPQYFQVIDKQLIAYKSCPFIIGRAAFVSKGLALFNVLHLIVKHFVGFSDTLVQNTAKFPLHHACTALRREQIWR